MPSRFRARAEVLADLKAEAQAILAEMDPEPAVVVATVPARTVTAPRRPRNYWEPSDD